MTEFQKSKFAVKRIVLLMEIERYCQQPDCSHLNRIALTKHEARAYSGFACGRCETWYEDNLSKRDVAEWWDDLAVNS